MNAQAGKYRRRQYLVAKKFQLKYVGTILLFIFLTGAISAFVVYYTSMMLFGEKLSNVYPQGRLIHDINIINMRILASLLLATPVVALIGIILSHRIAGPIYRMEKYMTSIAQGDFSQRIVLRRNDELIKLADAINTMVDSLSTTITGEQALLAKVNKELNALKDDVEKASPDHAKIRQSFARLNSEIIELSKALDKYKLP